MKLTSANLMKWLDKNDVKEISLFDLVTKLKRTENVSKEDVCLWVNEMVAQKKWNKVCAWYNLK